MAAAVRRWGGIRAARPHRTSPHRALSAPPHPPPRGPARCRGTRRSTRGGGGPRWSRRSVSAAGSWGGGGRAVSLPGVLCASVERPAPFGSQRRARGPRGPALLPGRVPALHGHGLPAARRSDTASGVPRSAEGRSPDRSRCRSRPSARCRRSPSVVPPGWTAGAINWFFTPANLPTADSAARGNAARLVCIG